MNRLWRQRPFLTSILQEANRFKRQEMLKHAKADQIDAVSEMVLNLLKRRIPIKPQTLRKLQRHKNVLREVGKRRNSLTSVGSNREWILARFERVLRSMSLKTRDADGYPLQGIDVVPERVSENRKRVDVKDNLSKLIGLLQEANHREEQLKVVHERLLRKY